MSDVPQLPKQALNLQDVVNWLSGDKLDPDSVRVAVDTSSSKLKLFSHVLASSRASRLQRLQPLIQRIQDRLTGTPEEEGLIDRVQDPRILMDMGRFLVDLQEKDANFVRDVSTDTDLSDLTTVIRSMDNKPVDAKLADLPPDRREKVRLFLSKFLKVAETRVDP